MNQNPIAVVTNEVRLSFVHLFTPYSNQADKEPKYSTTVLVPKSDFATKQKIDAAIAAAVQEGVSSKWNGVRPPVVSVPVHDGDGVRPSDGMPFGEECKGHWVFTASSKQAPGIVDQAIQPVLNQTEVYSGMYARVSIRFFAYFSNGKKGIGIGLNNVQKTRDGEPLGGRTSATDDFGGGGYAAPSYPQQTHMQQQGYQQPGYPQQAAIQQPMHQYTPQQPPMQQYTPQQAPAYQQPPVQQGYAQQQPMQFDPITGKPIVGGGIMGL